MNQDNEKDIRLIFNFVLMAIGGGLVVVFIHQLSAIQTYNFVPFLGLVFFPFLWAMACLISGGGIGFLFGIPRILTDDRPRENEAPGNNTPAPDSQRRSNYRPSTNLDRISDWLTTLIVGLTLVQWEAVVRNFNSVAGFIAFGLDNNNGDRFRPFAGAIIIYFSALGFLGSYLMTRVYLSKVFENSDVGGLGSRIDEDEKIEFNKSADLSDPRRIGLSTGLENTAQKILDYPLEQLTSVSDITAWSKAQFASHEYEKAITGYAKAVQSAPNDIQLRLEYTNALFYAEQSATDEAKKQQYRAESEQQLLKAYGLLAASSDPVTKMKVYRALTFFYLFSAPPAGFEKAIKFGEEFVNDADPRKIPSGGLWVNLAAGYGQKFKWLKEQKTMPEEKLIAVLKDAHQKALHAAAEALKMDRNGMWLNRLRTLLRTDISKDADDNDLEVFEKDNAFRQLLQLP